MKKKQKKKWELDRHGQKWTQREDNLLWKLYPDKFNHELVNHFNRTENAISGRAKKLEIRKIWRKYDPSLIWNHKLWSQKEIGRLKKLYPIMPIAQLLNQFPKRNKNSIRKKAKSLHLKKTYLNRPDQSIASDTKLSAKLRMWFAKDIRKLRTLWQQGCSKKEISQIMGKTIYSVNGQILRQIRDLGLQKKFKRQLWSSKELKQLKKLYPITPTTELLEHFPKRNRNAICNRAKLLGLKKERFARPGGWSDKEIKKLRRLWEQGHTKSEIAKIIGKTRNSIHDQIRKQIQDFGLQKRFEKKQWSKKEIHYLIQHHKNTSDRQLATIFGRTIGSVRIKARLLGLLKENHWSARDKNLLVKLYPTMNNDDLAKKFGRTRSAINAQAVKMGLHKLDYKPRKKMGKRRLWSKKEDALIKKLYPTVCTKDLAVRLNRTAKAVSGRAEYLEVRKAQNFTQPRPNAWSDKEKKKIRR